MKNIVCWHREANVFDHLFSTYYKRLVAYAMLFVGQETAKDIVQDLFVHLWSNSDNIAIRSSLESYMFTSIYRRCLNHLKRSKRTVNEQLAEIASEMWDPDSNETIKRLFINDMKKNIDDSIETLPQRCRQVFVLSYIHRLKNREIANTLGISENTVETHISKALKSLRKKLLNNF